MTVTAPMEMESTPQQEDPVARAVRQISNLVKSHPNRDQELFMKAFLLRIKTSDKEEEAEALRTMIEILRDNGCDKSAQAAMLMLPAISSEDPPKNKRLRAWADFVAAAVKRLREDKGWSQDKLAEEANIGQSHICRIERGVHAPSGKTIRRLAKALGVEPGKLDPTLE